MIHKNHFFMLFVIFSIFSCSKSYHEDILAIDSEGRELSIKVIFPVSNLNTLKNDINIICHTNDNLNKISKVEISFNQNSFFMNQSSQNQYEKQFMTKEGENSLCAKITSNTGGTREQCLKFYKTLSPLQPYPASTKSGSCIFYNQKIYCIGGEGTENDFIIFDSQSGAVLSSTKLSDEHSRKFTSITQINGKIYILGGLNNKNLPPLNFLTYDTLTNQWGTITTQTDSPSGPALFRVSSQAVAVQGKIYLIGGGMGFPGAGFDIYNSTYYYDPTETPVPLWHPLQNGAMKEARAGFVAISDGTSIWVAGGYNLEKKVLNSFEVYNTQNPIDGWQFKESLNQPRFLGSGALIKKRFIYLFGGINFSERLKTIERYDLILRKWEVIGTTDLILTEPASANDEESLFIIGGANQNDEPQSSFIRFKPFIE